MTENDRKEFYKWWRDLMRDDYGRDVSVGGLERAFDVLFRFELDDIRKSVLIHQSSESDRYGLRAGNLVTILEGAGEELALQAWQKLITAIERVGSGDDVIFDDPVIHRLVHDEGGWVKLCGLKYDDLEIMKHRFVRVYIQLKNKRVFDYPKMLNGLYNAQNSGKTYDDGSPYEIAEPRRIGDDEQCRQVYIGGKVEQTRISEHRYIESTKLNVEKIAPSSDNGSD